MLTTDDLNKAIAKSIKFFEKSREPHALLWLAVMHRRFAIAEFADALQRYDQRLIEQPETAALLRVLRRFADRETPLQPDDWDAVTTPSDRILVSALYCDRVGLPGSFPEVLQNAAKAGGYNLPHVILTLVRIQENGCALPLPDGFIEAVYRAERCASRRRPDDGDGSATRSCGVSPLGRAGRLGPRWFRRKRRREPECRRGLGASQGTERRIRLAFCRLRAPTLVAGEIEPGTLEIARTRIG